MILAALLLALQPPTEPPDESPFSERQPVRLAPVAAARAFEAFRTICMANFPDPAAFDAAAAASGLGFTRSERPERGEQEWTSRHGQIILRQAHGREADARRDRREGRGARRRWVARCDFWVAIEEPLPSAELLAAIGRELAGGARPVEEIVGVSWRLGPAADDSLKLVYLPSFTDDRLFTLSLQRLADAPPR